MNTEEAIRQLREAGFAANLQEIRGEEVICCQSRERVEDAPRCVVHLIPIGEEWGIDLVGCFPLTRYEQRWSLEEATGIAIRILGSQFIPIRDRDLLITYARSHGGDRISMTHLPTRITRVLKEPGRKKGVTDEEKERAYREIVLELAWQE